MIPANTRSLARSNSRDRICTAALYSVVGICRCPKCHPETGAPPAPDAAARTSGPFPPGGGTPSPSKGATAVAPMDSPAAGRTPSLSGATGGLFDQEQSA